jgi:hypothetical protein
VSGQQPSFRATPADHAHAADETCPYCEQPISNDRAVDIRARFDADARARTAAIQGRYDQQLAAKVIELEAVRKSELEKLQETNAQALQQLKEDGAEQQRLAREQGKNAAEAESREKIEALTVEREAAMQKSQEAEQQRLELATQITELKEQQEAAIKARTEEVRVAYEKQQVDKINEINAKHASDMTKAAEQLKTLQERLAAEEGEGADVQLFELLKAKFPKDDFRKIGKNSGADIVQTVKHNKRVCGKIVYDSNNRNRWDPAYAANLRKDMVAEGADHAILTTSKFPKDVRQIHCCDEVIVANPARVFVVAEILRREVVKSHTQRISLEDRTQKSEKLYGFITSDGFENMFGTIIQNYDKLLKIDEDERKAHNTVWEKRGRLLMSTQALHTKIHEKIDQFVGTGEEQKQ